MGLRAQNLAVARNLIRTAALEAFLDDGYVGTTMTDVARRAGVARQTVYNLFESKATLLVDVIGHQVADPEHRDQGRDRAEVLGAPDAGSVLHRFAVAHRRVVERTAPIMRVALQAAAVDEAVGEHLRRLEADRVVAVSAVVDAVAGTGTLRSDEPIDVLARGLAVLTSPTVAVAALDGGLTTEDFERWIALTSEGLLVTQ